MMVWCEISVVCMFMLKMSVLIMMVISDCGNSVIVVNVIVMSNVLFVVMWLGVMWFDNCLVMFVFSVFVVLVKLSSFVCLVESLSVFVRCNVIVD